MDQIELDDSEKVLAFKDRKASETRLMCRHQHLMACEASAIVDAYLERAREDQF
jgi:hypothetical protein